MTARLLPYPAGWEGGDPQGSRGDRRRPGGRSRRAPSRSRPTYRDLYPFRYRRGDALVALERRVAAKLSKL